MQQLKCKKSQGIVAEVRLEGALSTKSEARANACSRVADKSDATAHRWVPDFLTGFVTPDGKSLGFAAAKGGRSEQDRGRRDPAHGDWFAPSYHECPLSQDSAFLGVDLGRWA